MVGAGLRACGTGVPPAFTTVSAAAGTPTFDAQLSDLVSYATPASRLETPRLRMNSLIRQMRVPGTEPASGRVPLPSVSCRGDPRRGRLRRSAANIMPMTGGSLQSALQKFRATAIEARIADVPATDDDAAVVATLIQGLSSPPTALLRGYTPSPVDTHAAYWRAARDGIDGHGIDPVSGHLVPATDPILRLLDHLRPALGRTSDYHRAHQAHQRSSPAAPAPSSNAAPSEQAHRRTRST